MKGKLVCLSLVTFGMVTLSSCAKIQEPWVQSENQLKQERTRTPEQQQALRQRLLLESGFRQINLAD
jgi:hypothetical protein